MIEFTCTHCGHPLRVNDAAAGKKCRCSGCGKATPIPIKAALVGVRVPTVTEGLSHPSAMPAAPELCDFLSPPEGPDEIGRLGGYRVLRVLGAGGMGVVYEAEDPRLKRPVALKAMLPVVAASATNRQRFVREAQAAAAIEHDQIVTIYQVGEDRNIPFIAMQLLKGESLEDHLLRVGRLGATDALRIAKQIARGLAVAHERGLIHRDIKPSNLWLEPLDDGSAYRVKVLDFGLARSVEGDAQLTRDGAIVGTPAYLAPEQSRSGKLDGRCDLFSLGCVLYRMCTGRLPFQGTDTLTTLLSLARDDPPPPQEINPELPAGVSRLILDLLSKDPKGRPPSARALIQRIEELEGSVPRSRSAVLVAAVVPAETPRAPARRMATLAERPVPAASHTALIESEPADDRRKWLLVAAGVAGAGLLLVLGVGILVVILWVNSGKPASAPDAGKQAAAPENRQLAPEREASKPAAPDAGRPPVAPNPGGPPVAPNPGIPPIAPNPGRPLPPPPFDKPEVRRIGPAVRPVGPEDGDALAVARTAAKNRAYSQTEVVGFPLHPAFEEIPPEGAVLIGFEVTLEKFAGANDVIHSLRPIFLTDKGELLGQVHGTPTNRVVTIKAKPGYAVGAVTLLRHLRIDGIRVTFMRIDKKTLDPDQSYQSEDIASIGGRFGEGKTLSGHGQLIIGICGKGDDQVCDALGLVVRGKG
jgi:hypothetical protein